MVGQRLRAMTGDSVRTAGGRAVMVGVVWSLLLAGSSLLGAPARASAAVASADVAVAPPVGLSGEPPWVLPVTPAQAPLVSGAVGVLPSLPVLESVPGGPVPIGGGFDPAKSVEVPAERGQLVRTFVNPNGTHTAQVSLLPLNYASGKGWLPVDNRVVKGADGVLRSSANEWSARFEPMGAGSGVALSTPDGDLRFWPEGVVVPVVPTVEPDGVSVRYREVWPGIDLVYTVTGAGVEEVAQIKRAGTVSPSFVVEGATFTADASGLQATGVLGKRVRISRPESFDAKGQAVPVSAELFDALTLVPGVGKDAKTRISLGLDPLWLAGLAPERFPVSIDPTTMLTATSFVHSFAQYGSGGAYGSFNDGYARIGNPVISGSPSVRWRSTAYYDYTPVVGHGYRLTDAWLATNTVAWADAGAWAVQATWASADTFNGTPGYATLVSDSLTTGAKNLSSAALLAQYQTWADSGEIHGTLGFVGDESGPPTLKKFTADLYISYNKFLPLPATPTAPANGTTIRSTATLSATVPQQFDGDGDQVRYRFYTCTDSACSNRLYTINGGAWSNVSSAGQTVSAVATFSVTPGFTSQTFWWGIATWDGIPNAVMQPVEVYPAGQAPSVIATNQAPSSVLVSPVTNAVVTSLTPTMTALVRDPDATPGCVADPNCLDRNLSYRFVLAPKGGSGILAAGPWTVVTTSVAGVSVSWNPAQALVSGAGYSWRVETKDGYGLAGTGSSWFLTPQGRLGADAASPMQSVGAGSVNLATGNLFIAAGAGRSIATVGGTVGVGLSYNSQDRSSRGLLGQYWVDDNANGLLDAAEVRLARVDHQISFDWINGSPGESVPTEFRARWTGYMQVPTMGAANGTLDPGGSGRYWHSWVFGGGHDDNLAISVAGTTVYNATCCLGMSDTSAAAFGTSMQLLDGSSVKVVVDYQDVAANAYVEFRAKADGVEQAVTDAWFTLAAPDLPIGWTMSADTGLSAAWTKVAILPDGVAATAVDGSQIFFQKTINAGLTAWSPPAGIDDTLAVNTDRTVTIHGADGLVYVFDLSGRLTSIQTAADDLKPAGATTTWSPGTDPTAPLKLTQLTDRLALTRTIKLSYQQTGLLPTSGACPTGAGFDTSPPNGMLCQIDYPDSTQTRLYYQNGLLARISDPGDETVTTPGTTAAPEGRAVTDLSWDANGTVTQILSAAGNDRARAQTANPAVFGSNLLTANELALTLTTGPSPFGRQVTGATFPAAAHGTTAAQTTIAYTVPLDPLTGGQTQVTVSGVSGVARTVAFDGAGRHTAETDMLGRVTTTQWSPGLDLTLWSSAGGRTTSTVYDQWWHPTDVYGPVPTACFTFPSPVTETTNGPAPTLANSGCSSSGVTQVPHTHTDYDGGLSGMTAAVWANRTMTGTTLAHRMAPGTLIEYNDTQAGAATGWSARYTGWISPPAGGNYTLNLNTAGTTSATLIINDVVQAKLGPQQGTTLAFGISGASATRLSPTSQLPSNLDPWKIRLEVSTTTATENVSIWWTTPLNSTSTQVPNTVVKPGFFYPTKTTVDDTTGSSQVAAQSVTATKYDDGIDPSFGVATSTTVDPAGLALTTKTLPETGATSLLRPLTRTLPAYAAPAVPSGAVSTTYGYYAPGASVANPCAGGTAVDQAQMRQFTTGPTPAVGAAIVTEVVYDILGRVVASRYSGDTVWQCVTYDTRGRVTTVTVPAYGGFAARTKTTTYMVGGDPTVTTVADGAVAGSTNGSKLTTRTDALGQVISTTDVWGQTATTTYDIVGRVVTSANAGGTMANTYDNASRLTAQSLDGATIATVTYTPSTDPLDPGVLSSISYPTGGGNGTSLAPITRDVYGRETSLDWRQAGGTALTKDTVTRSLSGQVLTDTIDTTLAWSYTYDGAGRLTAAAGSGHSYAYNYATATACGSVTGAQVAAGLNTNRTSLSDYATLIASSCYDEADRLLSTTAAGYTGTIAYDSHGNTTTVAGQTLGYDYANRHLSTVASGGNVTYGRDVADRLVVRTPTAGIAQTVRYSYPGSGDQASLVLDGTGTLKQAEFSLPGGVLMTKNFNGPTVVKTFGFETTPVNYNNWYGTTVSQSTAQAHSGSGSLQAVTNATYWAVTDVWPGTVPVTAGTVYTISAWTKAGTRTANVALEVNWLNSSGTNLGRVGVASGTNSLTVWTALSGTATAPAGAVTASIDVAAGSTSGETHWIDDITVTTAGNGSTGSVWSYPNLHGDIQATADQTGVRTSGPDTYDPYGTLITGVLADNMTGTMDDGWLGQHQRPLEHEPGIQPAIEMGARTYNPTLARFLQSDPIEGGSANNYDYCTGDPINCSDLSGTIGWKKWWHKHGGQVLTGLAVAATLVAGAASGGAFFVVAGSALADTLGTVELVANVSVFAFDSANVINSCKYKNGNCGAAWASIGTDGAALGIGKLGGPIGRALAGDAKYAGWRAVRQRQVVMKAISWAGGLLTSLVHSALSSRLWSSRVR